MNAMYDITFQLWIKGPILSSSGGTHIQGLDRTFYRDSQDNLAISASHIKGKLRESLVELDSMQKIDGFQLDKWFGKTLDDNMFRPAYGCLYFTDFVLDAPDQLTSEASTRISIDSTTGTAKEQFLQINEKCFEHGSSTSWIGHIFVWSEDQENANLIKDVLTLGFKWITALGSMKGCGYGRIENVCSQLDIYQNQNPIIPHNNKGEYSIYLEMLDDLFIGGNVNAANYRESEVIIPGSVLKGSIARCINELCGVETNTPIDEKNLAVSAKFPVISKYFTKIKFSHAFPSPPNKHTRAVTVPFTSVYLKNRGFFDVALPGSLGKIKFLNSSPRFAIDWKTKEYSEISRLFGWQQTVKIHKTRTSIDKRTRTADEERLYTFQYISPFIDEKELSQPCPEKVVWITNFILPTPHIQELESELSEVFKYGWKFLGKRNSRFTFDIHKGIAPSAVKKRKENAFDSNLAIVTLQTDAALFNGYKVKDKQNLFELYKKYWDNATEGNFELIDFFARQKMIGRYFGLRYKQFHDHNYYPFILTEAGSVFILQMTSDNIEAAKLLLLNFERYGLPLPFDVKERLDQMEVDDTNTWKYFPFIKENGYGEIIVNLAWHWNKDSINKGDVYD